MKTIFFLLGCLILSFSAAGQRGFRIMSYNAENLFDCRHDSGKNDTEYLPGGARHWTPGRYYHKLQQIAKVILAAGEWDTPALVGLCEVENDSVLIHLLTRTPLHSRRYRYRITDSPDVRGIDVALLYRRDRFAVIGSASYPVRFSRHKEKRSRDILHVWGKIASGDTLDVFVCHFPSRYGGEVASEPDRKDAASVLKAKTDSLFGTRADARIVIMGDFNDTPADKSVADVLKALPPAAPYVPANLYNLFYPSVALPCEGSHKYQGEWSRLDQFIVSGALLDTSHSVHIVPDSPTLFAPAFLFTKDKTYRGMRPKRTYYGYKYEGGYSDHLPILLELRILAPHR